MIRGLSRYSIGLILVGVSGLGSLIISAANLNFWLLAISIPIGIVGLALAWISTFRWS